MPTTNVSIKHNILNKTYHKINTKSTKFLLFSITFILLKTKLLLGIIRKNMVPLKKYIDKKVFNN